ncbi:MAG TPA: hypothetical protein VJZ93_04105 [Candidatus Nanoarchaeia archaeon]|nr:hypothetical protein [Candidatus Nanoarchaeia archaeon]
MVLDERSMTVIKNKLESNPDFGRFLVHHSLVDDVVDHIGKIHPEAEKIIVWDEIIKGTPYVYYKKSDGVTENA